MRGKEKCHEQAFVEQTVTTPQRVASPLRRPAGAPQGFTLAVAAFFPIMAIVSLAPAIPRIMEHFQGIPNVQILVPLMVTAPGIMVTLLSPLAGWLTDRFGRRRILLIATLFYGFFGAAPYFLNELPPIFVSRLGVGASEAILLTVTNALYGDYFELNERRKWLTVQGVVGPIFATSVLGLSGILTNWVWNGSFLVYLIAFLVFVAMTLFLYEPQIGTTARPGTRIETALNERFPWKVALQCCAVTLFVAALYYVWIVQGGLAFNAVSAQSPAQLGVLIGIASIGVPIGAVSFGLLSKRWSVNYLIATFLGLFAIGMTGIGLSADIHLLTLFAFFQQVGAGMAVVTLIYWVTHLIPAAHRGRGMGMWVCTFFAGQFVSPLLFGAARAVAGGVLQAFLAVGLVASIGALVALFAPKRLAPQSPVMKA